LAENDIIIFLRKW